jgi:hypothetical protein
MAAQVPFRELTSEEPQAIATLAQARTAPARWVEHARILPAAVRGQTPRTRAPIRGSRGPPAPAGSVVATSRASPQGLRTRLGKVRVLRKAACAGLLAEPSRP